MAFIYNESIKNLTREEGYELLRNQQAFIKDVYEDIIVIVVNGVEYKLEYMEWRDN